MRLEHGRKLTMITGGAVAAGMPADVQFAKSILGTLEF